ncbi:MAG: tyrosine recombinase [Opitutales bacterium]|nr:tyrosine recombinase [Opitutales bacterium]
MKPRKSSLPKGLGDGLYEFRLRLEMELGKSKNTVASYLSDASQFAEFLAGKNIDSFAGADGICIAEWISEISKIARPSTQSRKLSAVKALADFLIEEKIWGRDFSKLVSRPKTRRPVPEVLSRAETLRLLAEPNGSSFEEIRDRAMLEFMYSSGLRVSELCLIKYSDLDFEGKIVRVCGKGDKVRLVPIGSRALGAIEKYLEIFKEEFERKKPVHLFITKRGRAMSRKTFWFNIKKYARRAGIEREVKPHMLRHCFATHLLGAGANLMAIKEMLGHSDLSTTQIYTKVADSALISEHAARHPRSKMKLDV